MNIFVLHLHPRICARYHCNKHVVKMILETCQLLCTAWHTLDPKCTVFTPPYKKTHVNHPCARWCRASRANYKWLCRLGLELCKEYTHRYQKVHKCEAWLKVLRRRVPDMRDEEWTTPPACMPNEYKSDDVVLAYRKYYVGEKASLLQYKDRSVPRFVTLAHDAPVAAEARHDGGSRQPSS